MPLIGSLDADKENSEEMNILILTYPAYSGTAVVSYWQRMDTLISYHW